MAKRHWRLEIIVWQDSTLNNEGWEDVSYHLKGRWGEPITSVGFALRDNKKGITLASSVHGKRAAGVVNIPAGMILKRKRLT